MTHRPPLGASAVWQAVMDLASNQCHCTGACGSQHSKTGLRCPKVTSHARLIVAPADLTLPPATAAAVPVEQLRAWCSGCHAGAQRRQLEAQREVQRLESAEPLSLF
ncbi:hypothetical protein [Streptomyces brasiliscabiei]|uniref:hypothetical protein n=1 Tax=Streptomyces brasiliscabiei TaxID=2736302 RepID=UPI0038F7C2CF